MNLARSAPINPENVAEDVRNIVIISYNIMGIVNGIGQSSVQVEAREVVIPDQQTADYYVRFEFSSGGDYPQTSTATVAYNDVERLVAMLKKLEGTSISTDRFALSEVQYEVGDLKIVVFNTDRGSTMAAINVHGMSAHLNSAEKLSSFTKLIENAKKHIENNKMF